MNNLDYGIIGNCRSAALISKTGAIDWCCIPDFDSPSVFARLLDDEIGGTFDILVDDDYTITQKYIRDTNILRTRFETEQDAFEILDFMPRYYNVESGYYNPPEIIRYFKYISGEPKFTIKYDPKLEYARHETVTKIGKAYIKSYTKNGEYDSLYLYSDLDIQKIFDQKEIKLSKDAFVLLNYNQKLLPQSLKTQYLKLNRTKVYWLDWANRNTTFTKYHDAIIRSTLVLKLLTYDKTGAVLAAITTSLPETIGEQRNWDYRFCWIRDASMAINVMTKLGHKHTVKRFINFIIDIIPDKNEKIQIMYGINREKVLTEETLDHLKGYKNSQPVRIGNAAYTQRQNDIYGILMDVIYKHFKIFKTSVNTGEDLWTIARSIVKIVKQNWRKPDKSIWEIRTEEKHFTFSKVLCWVAIDRAIKIAKLIKKDDYLERWQPLADEIRQDIYENAWNEKVQSYTQFYGSDSQDAANLLMYTYGFLKANDERYIKTVKCIENNLFKDGLMFRYRNKDDFGVPGSSFTICTFWLIESLYVIGEEERATEIFDKVLSYSNHLGLFSEDLDFKTKRLLGNFPQAYSHLALIEAAIKLAKGDVAEHDEVMDTIFDKGTV
ncbi:MAG: glycoside hydrolase family 15 protein [Fidelibacterota bacterium]